METGTIKRRKMACPIAEVCQKKVLWDMPVWRNGKQVGTMPILQGHCKPHFETNHCWEATKNCPPCEPVGDDIKRG